MKLIIEDDEGRKTVVPFVRDEISIGRKDGNTIRLTERNVSRRHARLVRSNGHVFIEDLGSYNGVKVNGDKVQGRAELREGDLIEIGDYNLALQAEAGELAAAPPPMGETTSPGAPALQTAPRAPAPPPPGGTARPAGPAAPAAPQADPPTAPQAAAAPPPPAPPPPAPPPPAPQPAAAAAQAPLDPRDPNAPPPSRPAHESTAIIKVDFDSLKDRSQQVQLPVDQRPYLVVLSTDYAGQEFEIDRSIISIGRTDENEVALDHRSMSRKHCRVYLDEDGRWKVADLGSANGVRVNGEEYGLIDLRAGDVIELGHVQIRFCAPGEGYVYNPDDALAYSASAAIQPPAQSGKRGLPIGIIAAVAGVVLLAGGGLFWILGQGGDASSTPKSDIQPMERPAPPTPDPTEAPPAVDPAEQLRTHIQAASEAVERQDWAAAQEAYQAALDLEDSNEAAREGLRRATLEVDAREALDAGKAASDESDWETAYERFVMVSDESTLHEEAKTLAADARKKMVSDLVDEAEGAFADEDFDGAVAGAERVLELEPKNVKARRLLDRARKAAAREAKRAAAEARAAARAERARKTAAVQPKETVVPEAAVDSKAEEAQATYRKGYELIRKQKWELGAKFIEKAIKLDPEGQKAAHKALGIAYARMGNYEKAAYHYRLFVEKNPSHRDAAQVRRYLQQYEEGPQ